MFTLSVRDHFMIAHSFKGQVFGPAQRLHGATYVVDLAFRRHELDDDGLVVDIGLASEVLSSELAKLNYRNLDDEPALSGTNTTTEFLARELFNRIRERWLAGDLGPGAIGLSAMCVTLNESHVAWASYEGELSA